MSVRPNSDGYEPEYGPHAPRYEKLPHDFFTYSARIIDPDQYYWPDWEPNSGILYVRVVDIESKPILRLVQKDPNAARVVETVLPRKPVLRLVDAPKVNTKKPTFPEKKPEKKIAISDRSDARACLARGVLMIERAIELLRDDDSKTESYFRRLEHALQKHSLR